MKPAKRIIAERIPEALHVVSEEHRVPKSNRVGFRYQPVLLRIPIPHGTRFAVLFYN